MSTKVEVCTQCGIHSLRHPIAAIMNTKDVVELETASIDNAFEVVEANGQAWAAMPVCTPCHQSPTLKAHFCARDQYPTFLRRAGSNVLGG